MDLDPFTPPHPRSRTRGPPSCLPHCLPAPPLLTLCPQLAKQAGCLDLYPDLAFKYAKLAAERGVTAACAAVAHAYATGQVNGCLYGSGACIPWYASRRVKSCTLPHYFARSSIVLPCPSSLGPVLVPALTPPLHPSPYRAWVKGCWRGLSLPSPWTCTGGCSRAGPGSVCWIGGEGRTERRVAGRGRGSGGDALWQHAVVSLCSRAESGGAALFSGGAALFSLVHSDR